MRIERISENKIKITVSLEDLVERNIDVETLNYNSREAQELFWDMMKKAELEFGFTTSDAQLCIEAVPDSINGYVVTITKVEDEVDEAFESIQKIIRSKYKKSELRSKKRNKKVCSPTVVYSFSSSEDLKEFSNRIIDRYNGESTLFRHSMDYYLILSKSGWCSTTSIEPVIQEYGKRLLFSNFYEGFLEEYGVKIAENNALEIIINFY